jgi:hypothetical protein
MKPLKSNSFVTHYGIHVCLATAERNHRGGQFRAAAVVD